MTSGAPNAASAATAAARPRPRPLAELPMLDGLRAVAAAAVLLTHVAFQSGEVVRGAGGALLGRFDAGVAVFFALSGFLLYRPYAAALLDGRRPPSGRRYALRRLGRILPAYWVGLVAVGLTASSAPAGRVVAHAVLGQTYAGQLFGSYTQTWSLCTEAAFYAVLPALAAGIGRLCGRYGSGAQPRALAGLAVAGYGWIALVHAAGLPSRTQLWLPGHLDWFAAGMALAALSVRLPGRAGAHPVARLATLLAGWPGTCWAAAGVLLWLAATPIAGPVTLDPIPGAAAVVKEAAYGLIAVLLMLPAALGPAEPGRCDGLGRLLSTPAARWLGRISYGIFLWHLLVLRAVWAVTGWAPFSGHLIAAAVLTGAGSVAAGTASWVLVERPALRLADRLAGARPDRRHPIQRLRRQYSLTGSAADTGSAAAPPTRIGRPRQRRAPRPR